MTQRAGWITTLLTVIVAGVLALGSGPAAAATTSSTPVCVSGFNVEVPVSVTVAPGDTLMFLLDNACPTNPSFFGIRAVGARTGATPATLGTVEYTLDGTTWLPVSLQETGFNQPAAVRYTAPTGGATSDAFYLVDAQAANGYAGYLYSVTIAAAPSGDGPNLSMWQQAIGRASATAACPSGYAGSWAQWPNGGLGGWVCTREVRAYGPMADD